MILKELKTEKINNIVIFVCDSLRWDYTPQSVIDKGITIKTIAASLYTAPSFPSIISGLYPPKTGIYNWEVKISNYIKGLSEADIILVLKETEDGYVKGSLRTIKDNIDVSKIAAVFGGGGHKKASGFKVKGQIKVFEDNWTIG